MSPEEVEKTHGARRAARLLPDLQEELGKLDLALENRIFGHINAGTLTPEVAIAAWLEKHAYRMLLRRFQARVRNAAQPED